MQQLDVLITLLLGPQQVGENSTKTLLYEEIKASRKQKINQMKNREDPIIHLGAHFEK